MAGVSCVHCGADLGADDAFCEACGETTKAAVEGGLTTQEAGRFGQADDADDAGGMAAATVLVDAPHGRSSPCEVCGGSISDDGFCDVCGAKARTWRDHWVEAPAAWVGAVCDRGIRHPRNEDAIATAATPSLSGRDDGNSDGSKGATDGWAVLVVCDGVTSAPDSDQASIAAATEARDHLVGVARSSAMPGVAARSNAAVVEASARAINAAARVAQVAVLGVTERLAAASPGGHLGEPPSCTFVAAMLAGRRLAVGWCGDSRAYWLGDNGVGRQLSTDHSLAAVLIGRGMSREDAERDPTAHTITRWLGVDSVDPTPDTVTLDVAESGWVLLCSDGLWNYASTADELADLVARAHADGATTPVAVAESLAAFANDQGGVDNISVALARVEVAEPAPIPEPAPGLEPTHTQES